MTLADKITQLRKQKGWSQIDLADRLDVSRQSVSKWEMSQAVPELDKIIKLSELFDVTTDYLLKDNIPDPEPVPEPEPKSEPEPTPEPEPKPAPEPTPEPPKKPRMKWPWILAAALCLPVILIILLIVLSYVPYSMLTDQATTEMTPNPIEAVQPTPVGWTPMPELTPTPSPMPLSTPTPTPMDPFATAPPSTAETAMDPLATAVPENGATWEAGSETIIQAVSTDEASEVPTMETYIYGNGQVALEGVPITPAGMAEIVKEYEPFGMSYDMDANQWYYKGEPVRVFTDVLISNGQSLESGRFRGTIRNFAGDGTIDIRTVRDYDHLTDDGYGTLIGVEQFDADPDAVWEESP